MDDSLQPTIDMLLNLAVFMWFGAVCPWSSFLNNDIIPIYRLIFLGVLILLGRRLPIILAMHKYIHQIEYLSQAGFVGFFGPIGVGAIFYLSICREFLLEITVDGKVRQDAQQVAEAANVVVWFLVICSIVVHGLSIPVGKAGYHLPRTISGIVSASTAVEPEPVPISNTRYTQSTATPHIPDADNSQRFRKRGGQHESPRLPLVRIGRSVIRSPSQSGQRIGEGQTGEPARPVNLVISDSVAGTNA